jgi:hypothetical protein
MASVFSGGWGEGWSMYSVWRNQDVYLPPTAVSTKVLYAIQLPGIFTG